ncbi:cyclic nucleotide-binding domain-containing protein [uncultured Aureimonas sp.]|uniref:cyclic nucleotide-binding domain-containing protein n=1 Tax=uncultured Aureimonas sp. TaxID=1604662 RepID=UPI0025FFFC85|nr:cyclic nucleotide-binding domain-containing protein [uncultured Aureimonas sp.]
MASAGRQRSFSPGEVLIEEGRDNASLFVLLEGEVEVSVAGLGRVALLGSGEILGEMSFVDRAPLSATARADQPTRTLLLDKRRMEARLSEDAGFAGRFYRALAIFLADRLRGTVARQKAGSAIGTSRIEEDELDETVLDGVSVAGLRFQEMLKTLSAATNAAAG